MSEQNFPLRLVQVDVHSSLWELLVFLVMLFLLWRYTRDYKVAQSVCSAYGEGEQRNNNKIPRELT